MLNHLSKLVTATGMAAALAVGTVPKPAAASTQSTINTILGAAAVVGGLVLYNNYEHKRQAANTIVGYTRNGGTIYGDGRIVLPSGQTIYPNSNGQYPWGQRAYYNPAASGYVYDAQRTGQYDATHRHGNAAMYRRATPVYQHQAYAPHRSYNAGQYAHQSYAARPTNPGNHYGNANHVAPGNHYGAGNRMNHGGPNGAAANHSNHSNHDDHGDHNDHH